MLLKPGQGVEEGEMRFGILGDAKIARNKLVPAIRAAGHEIICLGRRNPDTPSQHEVWKGVEQTSYEALFEREDIDAIYNPLPNHLHVPMSITAMQHNKHVLCEKPMALSLNEIDQLEAAHQQTGKTIYEAYMVQHHPQWQWVQNIDIGERQLGFVHFSYPPQPEGNIRNFAEMGGGPVWDIGCYCVLSGIMAFGSTPQLVSAIRVPEPHLDVEKSAAGLLDFGEGRLLHFSVSSAASASQYFRLVGREGWCALDVPFNPQPVTKGRYASHASGNTDFLSAGHEVVFAPSDHYQLMVEDFVRACQQNRPADFTQSRVLTSVLCKINATPYR